MPSTYILPDLPWPVLLAPSCAMRAPAISWWSTPTRCALHVEQVVHAAGRDDLVIRQVEPPPSKQVA